MKKIRGILQIRGIERLNNSIYGNPAYKLYLKDDQGNNHTGRTAPNSAAAYVITGRETAIECDYHFTKKGVLYVDYIYR